MVLDTLSISDRLQVAGTERKQADAIAKSIVFAISESKKEVANKLETRLLFMGLYLGGGTALGYIVSLLNTIISTLPN
jgi:hypothetical protein